MSTLKERSATPPDAVLADVFPLLEYRISTPDRERLFPADPVLRHFTRKNRPELFARGALKEVGGRLFAVAAEFDRAVLELSGTPRKSTARTGD